MATSKPAQPRSDLRVVLVGQERVGKSSAGNTILGRKAFDSQFSAVPLTLSCKKVEDIVLGHKVSVVDTPGLFSTQLSADQVKEKLLGAVELSSPGPHVFLLTLQLGRFTPQEQKGMEMLQKILTPDVAKHTLILFTYGDQLGDMDIEKFISEDDNLQKLLKSCRNQYHVFNNKNLEDREQVQDLLNKIDDISQGGSRYYQRKPSVERPVSSFTLRALEIFCLVYRGVLLGAWRMIRFGYCGLFNTIHCVYSWFERHIG